jgi:peptidoglycan/xylan/chitin deacetylase (PgdA/CDA1 family)
MAPTGTVFGLHGESHVPFDRLSEAGIEAEIQGCVDALAPIIAPAPLLRLPYGRGWNEPTVRRVTNRLGIRVVGWDVGTFDWDDSTPFEASVAFARHVWGIGGVVLLHQWPRRSPKLLAAVIAGTRAAGDRLSPLVPDSLHREVPTGLVPRRGGGRGSPVATSSRCVV